MPRRCGRAMGWLMIRRDERRRSVASFFQSKRWQSVTGSENRSQRAPIAQLDRASACGAEGWWFEPTWAHVLERIVGSKGAQTQIGEPRPKRERRLPWEGRVAASQPHPAATLPRHPALQGARLCRRSEQVPSSIVPWRMRGRVSGGAEPTWAQCLPAWRVRRGCDGDKT